MITLYTTHCPRCIVLESKLKEKKIEYRLIEDTNTMVNMGLVAAPVLDVDGTMYEFKQAVEWVNNHE